MANIEPDNTEKKIVSRRALINNGIALATGIYFTNPLNVPYTWAQKLRFKKEGKNKPVASGRPSYKDTYIDNFDC